MVSPLIRQKINELQEAIANQRRVYVLLKWTNGKQLYVFARKERLLDDILSLQKNHEAYTKQLHTIASVQVLETVSKHRTLW